MTDRPSWFSWWFNYLNALFAAEEWERLVEVDALPVPLFSRRPLFS